MKLSILPPALVYYTDALPDGVGGQAQGPFVRIKEKYRYDDGIHAHELEHVRQWWVTLTLHSFLYLFSRRYRLWAEAKAYRKQMRHVNSNGHRMTLDEAAEKLCKPRYKLNLSHGEAVGVLREIGSLQ